MFLTDKCTIVNGGFSHARHANEFELSGGIRSTSPKNMGMSSRKKRRVRSSIGRQHVNNSLKLEIKLPEKQRIISSRQDHNELLVGNT